MKRLVLLSLVLVLVPQSASADGCTENCVVEINCTTGLTIVRQMTPQELANRPVFTPISEPVSQPTPEPTSQPISEPVNPTPSAPTDTAVVQPTVETSTVIASMPQPPVLDLQAPANKVIVNASTNTATVVPLTVDEIIAMWLINWEAWFEHWSAYMNEYWSW